MLDLGANALALGKGGVRTMWIYEKRLQHPVKISRPNPALAKVIITQFGGPDGELSASCLLYTSRHGDLFYLPA